MTSRWDDGWLVFTDGGREVIRVQLPPGGLTQAECDAFIEHLRQEIMRQQAGVN